MGFALKNVANSEWRRIAGRQSIGRRKLRANVATSVAGHLGIIFQPEEEALFELATERLADMGSRARLQAGYPPRNGATCNFEQINAFDSRCDHATISILPARAVYGAFQRSVSLRQRTQFTPFRRSMGEGLDDPLGSPDPSHSNFGAFPMHTQHTGVDFLTAVCYTA